MLASSSGGQAGKIVRGIFVEVRDIDQGVLYVATGKKYIQEAIVSVESLKTYMPECHVTLYCDASHGLELGMFDSVQAYEETEYGPLLRMRCMQDTPYKRTLFLDSDTYVCEELSGLFTLLDRFDIAVAHRKTYILRPTPDEIPNAFHELNAGVFSYRMSDKMQAFFALWAEKYNAYGYKKDQPAFRAALYFSDLRIATLPMEYNCRYGQFFGYARERVKVMHGRQGNIIEAAKQINANTSIRLYRWNAKKERIELEPSTPDMTIMQRLVASVREKGFFRSIASNLSKLVKGKDLYSQGQRK